MRKLTYFFRQKIINLEINSRIKALTNYSFMGLIGYLLLGKE